MLSQLNAIRKKLSNNKNFLDKNGGKTLTELSATDPAVTIDVTLLPRSVIESIEMHPLFNKTIMNSSTIYRSILVFMASENEKKQTMEVAKDAQIIPDDVVQRNNSFFNISPTKEEIFCKQCGASFIYERQNVGKGGIFSCDNCGNAPYINIFYGDSEAHKIDKLPTWSFFGNSQTASRKRSRDGDASTDSSNLPQSYDRILKEASTEVSRFETERVRLTDDVVKDAARMLARKACSSRSRKLIEDPNSVIAAIIFTMSPKISTTRDIYVEKEGDFSCARCSKKHHTARSARMCCFRSASFESVGAEYASGEAVPIRRRSSSISSTASTSSSLSIR